MPDPVDLELILSTALAHQQAGRIDLAEAGYRTVLQHDPNEPDALNLLGVILQEHGDYDGSLVLLNHALAVDPDFPEALANIARAHRVAGASEAAADAARRAIALDPELVAAQVQLGRALLDLGDLEGAAGSLRIAVGLAPDSVDALVPLGMALIRLNDPRAADRPLTAAMALDADRTLNLAPALADLARAYRAAGDVQDAIAAARRAVAIDPDLADAQLQLAHALLALPDENGALEAFRRACVTAPDSLDARTGLAVALGRCKNPQSAVVAWQQALALKPDDANLLAEYAECLGELKRLDEALAAYRRADVLTPGRPRVQYGIARMILLKGDARAAAEVCRRTLETAPGWSRLWLLWGNCEAVQGHFATAADAYRRSLELEPGLADAIHDLAAIGERLEDAAARDAAASVVEDASRPVRDRIAAGYAAGKLADHEGLYDAAFAAYEAANRLLKAERAADGVVFDRSVARRSVDDLIAAVRPETFAKTAGWGDPSELPVFVVGMPRSGTSLVEQIAASHPLVFGAGERRDISNILTALGGEQPSCSPVLWDRAAMRREASSHIERLHELGGNALRVIDKMPGNINHLGQIAVLYPRARIVVCRRDLRDVGLSCFFQFFREDGMIWTNDLANCGFWSLQTDRLLAHWRKVLPFPILEVQYETLVGNLEGESRRLIEFLGLEWDPACLAFHETERTVLTASQWQVRQPLYASSVGRWKHYQHHLGPLLRELEGAVSP